MSESTFRFIIFQRNLSRVISCMLITSLFSDFKIHYIQIVQAIKFVAHDSDHKLCHIRLFVSEKLPEKNKIDFPEPDLGIDCEILGILS